MTPAETSTRIQALAGPSQAAKDRACAIASGCPPPTDVMVLPAEDDAMTAVGLLWLQREPTVELRVWADCVEVTVGGEGLDDGAVAAFVRQGVEAQGR